MNKNNKDDVILITRLPSTTFQLVTKESKDGKKWAIRDKFLTMTPYFDNKYYVIHNGSDSILFIGDNMGKRQLYVAKDTDNKEESFYYAIHTTGNLLYISELDDKTCIIKTDLGEYLFDKNTLEQKSDVYNSITCFDNALMYSKVLSHDNIETLCFGHITTEGKIVSEELRGFIYDEETDVSVPAPLLKDTGTSYDIIDEFALEDSLRKARNELRKDRKSRLKTLTRLNVVKK